LYFGAIIFESSTPFSRTTSVVVMHASVRQSKIQATASRGNSISHPTEQSKHFDTQLGFFLLNLKSNAGVVNVVDDEVEVDNEEEDVELDDDVDGDDDAAEEEDEGVAFDVDAP
jgi:hypothetical protein